MSEAPAASGLDRRAYRMPYAWFEDRDTANFRKTQPEMADPEECFRRLSWRGPDDRSYLLNNANRRFMTAQGPFRPPYFLADELMDSRAGEDAFVFCPGPSMAEADLGAFDGRLTIAVNSAGFAMEDPTYWAIFESNYMLQVLRRQAIPRGREFLFSPRVAVRWRGLGYTKRAQGATYWVARFEEERLMPHRTPAVAIMGAIAAAWWMGAARIWLIGMDVSRPKGQPYVKGVPFSQDGATNPIAEQLPALVQVRYPEVRILNCSPHSRDALAEAFEPSDVREAEKAGRGP